MSKQVEVIDAKEQARRDKVVEMFYSAIDENDHDYIKFCSNRDPWVLESTIEGSRMNITGHETPFSHAITGGLDSTVTAQTILLLIKLGADCSSVTVLKDNVFHCVSRYEKNFDELAPVIMQDLTKRGVNIKEYANAKNVLMRTPLHESSRANDIKLTSLLLSQDADINIRDDVGNTALHMTASWIKGLSELSGNPDGAIHDAMPNMLLLARNGCNPSILNNEGKSAIEDLPVGEQKKINHEYAQYLASKGAVKAREAVAYAAVAPLPSSTVHAPDAIRAPQDKGGCCQVM